MLNQIHILNGDILKYKGDIMFLKYLKYVIKHKWFVFIECCKMGIPIRGILHDLSKLRLSEFIPYMNFFYRQKAKTEYQGEHIQDNFSKAWLLHLKRNPHHYQYWLLNNDDGTIRCLEMPEKYIKEMVADWIGAGRAIHGVNSDMIKWFEENKDKIMSRMHSNSIIIMQEILNHIKEK